MSKHGFNGYHKPYYTYDELRWMPVEDVLDQLSCVKLAEALGVKTSLAGEYKRDPFLLKDDMMIKRLREWLEAR